MPLTSNNSSNNGPPHRRSCSISLHVSNPNLLRYGNVSAKELLLNATASSQISLALTARSCQTTSDHFTFMQSHQATLFAFPLLYLMFCMRKGPRLCGDDQISDTQFIHIEMAKIGASKQVPSPCQSLNKLWNKSCGGFWSGRTGNDPN